MEKAAAVGIAAALPRAEAAIEAGEWLTPNAKRPVTPEPPCSDAQSQQRNNADTDYQHRKSNSIVIEPMPALHTHDASPYQPATLRRSSPGARSRGRAFTYLVALRTLLVRFLRASAGKNPQESFGTQLARFNS